MLSRMLSRRSQQANGRFSRGPSGAPRRLGALRRIGPAGATSSHIVFVFAKTHLTAPARQVGRHDFQAKEGFER